MKMTSEVIIETRNLTKVYRDFWGRPKVQALKALDLQVHRGEIFGLLGPNGSGKTTTIKLLLGLLFPTEGDALIFNEPTSNVAKNERIGYLPGRVVPVQVPQRRGDAPVLRPAVQDFPRRAEQAGEPAHRHGRARPAPSTASSASTPRACSGGSAWPRR